MRITIVSYIFLCTLLGPALAQDAPKPLDPKKALTDYSFPLNAGGEPYRFQVELDKASAITGVAVFRHDDSIPFQTLPACKGDLKMELNEYDDEWQLLKHQDLNFDGFEDVQLLQYFVPHLGKSIFCIYTWNPREASFHPAPEIPDMDPVANAWNKTITVHEDLFGGVFIDSTYRWNGVELILANGRVSGSSRPDCGFTEYCSRLINGKMRATASRPFGCENGPESALICPSTLPVTTKKKSVPQRKK
jgi:hypothetical protein